MRSALFLLAWATQAQSACYLAHQFDGHAALAFNEYQITDDGLGSQVIELRIEGDSASVSPGGLNCRAQSDNHIVCVSLDDLTSEDWLIDIESGTVIYSQVRPNPAFPQLRGSKLMTGYLLRTCD